MLFKLKEKINRMAMQQLFSSNSLWCLAKDHCSCALNSKYSKATNSDVFDNNNKVGRGARDISFALVLIFPQPEQFFSGSLCLLFQLQDLCLGFYLSNLLRCQIVFSLLPLQKGERETETNSG